MVFSKNGLEYEDMKTKADFWYVTRVVWKQIISAYRSKNVRLCVVGWGVGGGVCVCVCVGGGGGAQ